MRSRAKSMRHWTTTSDASPSAMPVLRRAAHDGSTGSSSEKTRCAPVPFLPLAVEPTTGEVHLRHHVSPTGYYRGKKVAKAKGE